MLKGTNKINKRFFSTYEDQEKQERKETTMHLVEDKVNMYSRPFLDILC